MFEIATLTAADIKTFFENSLCGDPDPIPFVEYPVVEPRLTLSSGTLQHLNMPFPVAESDSEDIVMPDAAVVKEKVKVPKPERPLVAFTRISSEVASANKVKISEGLRNNSALIYTKYPLTKTTKAERFPVATAIQVYTLPTTTGVDFEYPSSEFPNGFVSFQDEAGERWKCVALWDGSAIIYVACVNAEVRLCGVLYTGSKEGKVRWKEAVEARNNIPNNFGSFAVSDRVLLDRRKAQWPATLKALRESCNGVKVVVVEEEPPAKRAKKEKKPKASVKDVLFTQVAVIGPSGLLFKAREGDLVRVEEVRDNGNTLLFERQL